MPISKTYKRYAPLCSFGVIGSGKSNVIIVNPSQSATSNIYAASAVLENVIVWDMRKAEMVTIDVLEYHNLIEVKNSVSKESIISKFIFR